MIYFVLMLHIRIGKKIYHGKEGALLYQFDANDGKYLDDLLDQFSK